MGYHPRFERGDMASFQTTRSRNSELWFINNNRLEEAVLGYAAKYRQHYSVTLYALSIAGNHIHSLAQFPSENRAHFMRDFNSTVARAISRYCKDYPGGRFFARRYSSELVPGEGSLEDAFFYTVLQPVQDGQVEKISEYPGYNSFHDAVWGIKRKFKVVDWQGYNEARRWRKYVPIKEFICEYELSYARLPGYEQLSQKEYALMMERKLELRRVEIVNDRRRRGLGFAGRKTLINKKPGSRPCRTKSSTMYSHRPRILCHEPKLHAETIRWYFDMYYWYLEASEEYREGNLLVEFPPGTYRPPMFTTSYLEGASSAA